MGNLARRVSERVLRTRNVACLRVMQALQASVPTALQWSGTSGGFKDELLSGFGGRERGGVEPPAHVAELAPHVGLESLIVLELEPLVGISRRVSLLADLRPRREGDEPHRSRRQQGE